MRRQSEIIPAAIVAMSSQPPRAAHRRLRPICMVDTKQEDGRPTSSGANRLVSFLYSTSTICGQLPWSCHP